MIRAIIRFLLLLPQLILDAIIIICIDKQEIYSFEFLCKKQISTKKRKLKTKCFDSIFN